MKINKTGMLALLAAGGLMALTPALQAQSTNNPATPPAGQPPRGNGANRLDKMAAELKLTDDQKPKFKDAYNTFRDATKDIHNDTSLSQDDRRAKMKDARDQLDASMKSLLTADQYSQWHMMSHRGQRPPAPQSPGGSTNTPSADLPKSN